MNALSRIEKLVFRLDLQDRVSKRLSRMQTKIEQFAKRSRKAFRDVATGAVGLVAVAMSFGRITSGARDMNKALGEVSSLGVVEDVLDRLNNRALKFSVAYGDSAQDFVRASYDIQSAISGLVGDELGIFTEASAILAKGTKADVGTITDYMGTMYGIFKSTAERMGRSDWVQQLAGQSALAVNMFKTDGAKIATSFTTLGSEGESFGVAMNEQMAILGTLGASMGGGEAGTKYRAFLQGIAKAQGALGMKFTDTNGQMLPMVDILKKLKTEFNSEALKNPVIAQKLQDAFGRKEAVGAIKFLIKDIDGLDRSIHALGQNKGMDNAVQMAKAMTDTWDRAGRGIEAAGIVLWQKVLPVFDPIGNAISDVMGKMVRWAGLFPNLARVVGLLVAGVLATVGAVSALTLIWGISQFVAIGYGLAMAGLSAAFGALKTAIFTTLPALASFAAALLANPLTWIVLAIVAVGAAIVGIIVYWDEIKQAFENNAWMKIAFFPIYAGIHAVKLLWEAVKIVFKGFAWLAENWSALVSLFANSGIGKALLAPFKLLIFLGQQYIQMLGNVAGFLLDLLPVDSMLAMFDQIKDWWANFNEWINALDPFDAIAGAADWVINKLSLLPGIDLNVNSSAQEAEQQVESFSNDSQAALLATPEQQAGGAVQQISSAVSNQNSATHVENLVVNTPHKVDGNTLSHQMAMLA